LIVALEARIRRASKINIMALRAKLAASNPVFSTEPMLINGKPSGGSIWREPLTRREGFLLAAVLIALFWAGAAYAQRHRPILVISEPERGATSVIT
jgi:hypothetical protein